MQNNNSKNKQEFKNSSLIGNKEGRVLLEFQAEWGIALRGGSLPIIASHSAARRLIHRVNLLKSSERQALIFSENIGNN